MNIPGYKIERRIGQGGMASVYLAIQESLERPVALKVLDAGFLEDPQFSERFLDEGRIIAALNHRNIITIHDVGVVGTAHYISMEYVEGGDLTKRIAQGIDWESALDIVETMGECLHFAHRAGVVHRDVKPGNILFRTDGTPLLTDFGIAKRLRATSDLTVAGSVLGTPSYLSPEQAQGKRIDGRADIYSLGIILYEMLAGVRPYDADTEIAIIFRHLQDPLPKLPRDLAHLQPLLDRMLAKRPKDRFRNAAAMVEFIRERRKQSASHTVTQPMASPFARHGGWLARTRGRLRMPSAREWAVAFWGLCMLTAAGWSFRLAFWAPGETPVQVSERRGAGTVQQPEPRAQPALLPAEPRHDAPTAVTEDPSGASSPGTSREQLERKIDRLLVRADVALAAQRLTLPENDNAYDYYREVLRRDPGNRQAKSGLREIAERYASLAEQQLDEGDIEGARRYLTRGMDVQPYAPGLVRVKDKIHRRVEIARLLRVAHQALADYRLTTPATHNAYYYYRRVLQVDPGNRAAARGMDEIAERYAQLAEKEIAHYRYPKAQHYIRLGLRVEPTNRRLRALRDQAQLKNAPKQLLQDFKGLFE
jgi:predicted Ser/Thr protein kinase